MNKGLFVSFAWNGIIKNKKFFIPYLLACSCMIMMFYIPSSLCETQGNYMVYVAALLESGCAVITFFSLIIIWYTNKFLIKRRQKEFGLYNILGMNKRNIAKILFWETIICFILSYLFGILFGIVFGKLGELVLNNLIGGSISYSIGISSSALIRAFVIYAIEFFILYVFNVICMGVVKPINLLHAEKAGEKPPKAKWVLGFLGAIILGAGYVLAIVVDQPVVAVTFFMYAVVLVIIGTFLLFIFGSIVICKLLQKNKKFYYKTQHFISISSMIHRMYRNGSGLASVCILSTMVLVMVSVTAGLYFGVEEIFVYQYPHSVNVDVSYSSIETATDESFQKVRNAINAGIKDSNCEPTGYYGFQRASCIVRISNGNLEFSSNYQANKNVLLSVFPLDEFNKLTGQNLELTDVENQSFCFGNLDKMDTNYIIYPDGKKLELIPCDASKIWQDSKLNVTPELCLVTSDFNGFVKYIDLMNKQFEDVSRVNISFTAGIDASEDNEITIETRKKISENLQVMKDNNEIGYTVVSCKLEQREEFTQEYGALFFVGMMLSLVFLFATVLIIYYKQISEGYEDQSRFEIMQKVGMAKEDVRKSINSQMRVVFFAPLIAAACHLTFAFPMLQKMLVLFNLKDIPLFVKVTLITFTIFVVFYVIVYKLTTNAYYSIAVSGKDDRE